MSEFNKLTYDELIQINDELRYTIDNLKKQLAEYEKCTARVYAPNKSYKELEEKLAKFEEEKQNEINRLVDAMAQVNKEMQSIRQTNYNLKSTNINLEQTIEQQNVVITLAAGYISSTPQFSNDHPINVKKWLMGGME
jgi:chromosome segregation ATPase